MVRAADEALKDSGWTPSSDEERERAVRSCTLFGQENRWLMLDSVLVLAGRCCWSCLRQHSGGRGLWPARHGEGESLLWAFILSARRSPLTRHGPLVQKFRRVTPFVVPRILINLAAGHISIEHGLKVRCYWHSQQRSVACVFSHCAYRFVSIAGPGPLVRDGMRHGQPQHRRCGTLHSTRRRRRNGCRRHRASDQRDVDLRL
jgi:hypothetical protein